MAVKWGLREPQKLTGKDVIQRVRLKLSDTVISKYSDNELLAAINEAIDILWRALARHYSTITHKVREYSLDGGAALLPEDFYTVVELIDLSPRIGRMSYDYVKNRYDHAHIEGNYVFGSGQVRLVYNYFPRDITLLGDVVDVPIALEQDIVAITAYLVIGNADEARNRADSVAGHVSQNREIGPVKDMVAFP